MITSNKKIRRLQRLLNVPKQWNQFEFILWVVPFLLVLLSSFLILSIQRQVEYAYWSQHFFTGVIGIILAFLISQIPLERIRLFLIPFYLTSISGLIAVRFVGTSALGAQRWLTIGGFNVQPSEIAKITIILVLSAILERQKFANPLNLWKPIIVILLPWLLVFLQPDLGTSLVFGAILFVMLYWSGMPFEWGFIILSTLFTAILAGVFPLLLLAWIPFLGILAYRSLPLKKTLAFFSMFFHSLIAFVTPWLWMNILKDYQRDRLILFLNPSQDPLGGGYHLIQSTIGIGSGGFLGTGILQGELTKLRFIPEQHTDFIFSALGEETGFLGSLFVIIGFLFFILRLIRVSRDANTDFESLVVIGIGTMFTFQMIVNIFMTIGLGPITGIPLPFMSYGRTALLVNFASLGFCLSVARRARLLRKNL